MKYCPYCGAGLDVDMRFCPNCGKPFEGGKENPHLAGKSVPPETAAAPERVVPPEAETAPKPKKRGGQIALIAAAVVLAVVGGLFAAGVLGPKEEPATPFSDDTEAIEQASKSVVMLTCYDKDGAPYATGSGFAVFEDGVIVTNYHVIEREVYRVKAETEGGGSFECPTVLAFDAEKDIAILKADRDTGLTLLTPGSAAELQKGAKVVAIGSPLGLINSVSTGVFSGYIDDDIGRMLQFTAPISHGSSGGALFNDEGEVIGVTFASLTEGQSLNLGVPMDDVKALYESIGSQKPMTMEAFYETFDHTPPIPTYTVGYVLEHYRELDGQEIYIEGFVSSIRSDEFWHGIYMVDTLENVLGLRISAHGTTSKYIDTESMKRRNNQCALITLGQDEYGIEPGNRIRVYCLLTYKETDLTPLYPTYGINFTSYDFLILE